ncbi:MAG: AAA family ATPase [Anaerolineaceae bacterium]|nr:AAA family ATPase [Anaerolineaceae bacterium]
MTDQNIKQLFSRAYILGGTPCSGKSTLAERLSNEFAFQYYKVDDHESEHARRIDPNRHPVMIKYAQMSWDERWMRPVSCQVEELFDYYHERFEMIVQDLENYDHESPIVLEGAAYLPDLLVSNNANPERVLFLVPSSEFQRAHYSLRPWINQILKGCEDPEQAFENWMMRDQLFGKEILLQSKAGSYGTILVDGSKNIDQQYEVVKHLFKIK